MSSRPPPSLSDGEASSEDGEKVATNASLRKNTDIDPSARLASSSRTSRPSGRKALLSDRNANLNGYARTRERSRSPFRRERSGSRSPYRADTDNGREKRRREDDQYSKSASDPRRYKTQQTKARPGLGHSNTRDADRPALPSTGLGHGGRRDRDRSRSPFRAQIVNTKTRTLSSQTEEAGNKGDTRQRDGVLSTQREFTPQAQRKEVDTKLKTHEAEKRTSGEAQVGKASEQSEEVVQPENELSEAELIVQRRKKREAIRKKHDSLLRATLESSLPSTVTTPYEESSHGSEQQSPPSSANSPGTPADSPSAPASPADLTAVKDEDLVNPLQVNTVNDDQEQSAADYDPNQDINEDRPEFQRQDLHDIAAAPPAKPSASVTKTDDFDMFAEDDDDMFAVSDVPAGRTVTTQARALDESLLDNWDYPDGHYRIINGELLDGRYAVEQQIGKGTFATVVRARDANTGNRVAIKIACRNDTMLKAGQKEMQFLNRLNERDPDDKRYIIRLLGNFTHKGHLCLVFEGLHMDLREVLKKFGRDIGIHIDGVKVYAYQMFQALQHLKHADVLHADLKPDNILVNEKRTLIKICDFGTATLQQDAELTPYLVSRFYRAPEVILGMEFDYAIDMWAIGCTLYELYAGRILFNGSDNNNMLRVIQECRGKLPNRLIKRAKLADKYFDDSFTFHGLERDKMTGNIIHRPMHFAQGLAGKDLKSRLSGNLNKMAPAMLKEHNAFVDLLDKCLQLDPEKRIKPKDALHHHFFARPSQQAKPKSGVASAATFRPITVQHTG